MLTDSSSNQYCTFLNRTLKLSVPLVAGFFLVTILLFPYTVWLQMVTNGYFEQSTWSVASLAAILVYWTVAFPVKVFFIIYGILYFLWPTNSTYLFGAITQITYRKIYFILTTLTLCPLFLKMVAIDQ